MEMVIYGMELSISYPELQNLGLFNFEKVEFFLTFALEFST